jgi:hypothetical protein
LYYTNSSQKDVASSSFSQSQREALFDVVFVHVFLERLESNSHLLHDPFLEDFLFFSWKIEVLFQISP